MGGVAQRVFTGITDPATNFGAPSMPGSFFPSSGGKGGSPPPTAPDFQKAATPNQTNAFGTTSQWSQGPGGQWNQQQNFGGPLGGAAQGMEGQLAGAWGKPLDSAPQARDSAQQAIYGQETSMPDPPWGDRPPQYTSQ